MAQLAIKCHATRGKEVIETLEMLGGKNILNLTGYTQNLYYHIDNNNIIIASFLCKISDFKVFTVEEFYKKFPYKVGDKVSSKYLKNYKIEKMEWEDTNDRVFYKLQGMGWYNASELQPYKEETMKERKYENLRLDADQDDKLATEATIDGDKITPPENYLIGKVTTVGNGLLVEFVKKQPQYPKTFIEVLNFWHPDRHLEDDYQRCYKKDLIEKFQDLLYARDAYWKIAGEQMGLGRPWEPDWEDTSQSKHSIWFNNEGICIKSNRVSYTVQHILTFPTIEMRDAFYENFKDLIELCKELL